MTIIDLLEKEVREHYPDSRRLHINESKYTLHCSLTFRDCFIYEFMKAGFSIPVTINGETLTEEEVSSGITTIHHPTIGILNIIIDMEQGYKIIKDGD